jgi:hypothetical protein
MIKKCFVAKGQFETLQANGGHRENTNSESVNFKGENYFSILRLRD